MILASIRPKAKGTRQGYELRVGLGLQPYPLVVYILEAGDSAGQFTLCRAFPPVRACPAETEVPTELLPHTTWPSKQPGFNRSEAGILEQRQWFKHRSSRLTIETERSKKRLRKERAKKRGVEDVIKRPAAAAAAEQQLHVPRPDAAAQRQDLHEAAGGANVTGHVWLARINWLSTTCGEHSQRLYRIKSSGQPPCELPQP